MVLWVFYAELVTAELRQLTAPIGFAEIAEDVLMDKKFDSNKLWLKLMNFGRLTKCHQIPERSFFINGFQFPVCSRCTGVFFGWIAAICLIFFYKPNIFIVILFCLAMFIDLFLQSKNIIKCNNIRRFITGTL